MKLKAIIILATLIAAASVTYAQKVRIDVNDTFDFKAVKTFGFAGGRIAPKPTTSALISAAIEREMTRRGLVRNDAAPDIQIAAAAAVGMDLQGVGPSWNNSVYKSWGGYGNPAAMMTISTGDLMIDVIETKTNYSIYLGTAHGIFVGEPHDNMEKELKHMKGLCDKWVGKLLKKYPAKKH